MATALLKLTDVQLGVSGTATNNFTIYQPASPDGTLRIGNGNSGAATDVMTLVSNGKVGIGNTAPNVTLTIGSSNTQTTPTVVSIAGATQSVAGGSGQLGIYGTDAAAADKGGTLSFTANTTSLNGYAMASISGKYQTAGAGVYGGYLQFCTTDSSGTVAERMRIDSSGNVGIGNAASAWSAYIALQVGNGSMADYGATQDLRFTSNAYYAAGGNWKYISNGYACQYCIDGASGTHHWHVAANGSAGANTTNSGNYAGNEAMRIDNNGNLLVGTTNAGLIGRGNQSIFANIAGQDTLGLRQTSNSSFNLSSSVTTTSGTRYHIGFSDGAGWTERGTISTNGTGTTYGTASDYRLKENVQPMQNALETVAQLKPVTYTWKETGSDGQGFIAHELQAVVPDCVTGEKDAVDADGNPVYQGIDTSFLVATLTKAIQELNEKLNQQAAEIATLKGTK